MQSEEFKEFYLGHNMLEDYLLEGLLSAEEKKESGAEHEQNNADYGEGKKPSGRSKGRPKGERNSKNSERKVKDTLNQENLKKGHWAVEENKRYHWFLQIHHHHFICKEMRRLDKIFKTMATFIGSREAEQCRSHHQKMEKKHNSFPNILLHLRRTHYGTEDTHPVEEDMHASQVQVSHFLLTMDDLKGLQTMKGAAEGKLDNCQQSHLQFEVPQKQASQYKNQHLEDLFGEKYEENLELNSLLF